MPSGAASAACGSDILFLGSHAGTGREINIILPFNQGGRLSRTSVNLVPGAIGVPVRGGARAASQVIVASENRASGNAMVYEYANLLLDGLAIFAGPKCWGHRINLPWAVMGCGVGDGPGGTSSLIQHLAFTTGLEPEISILPGCWRRPPPRGLGAAAAGTSRPRADAAAPCGPGLYRGKSGPCCSADGVGSSKIMEEQVPNFVEHFMGTNQQVGGRGPPLKPLIEKHLG